MPVLKPSGYRKEETLLFKENLIDNEVSPIVAYAKDMGQMMMYESAEDEKDFGERFAQIKEEAIKNIAAIDVDYEIAEVEGGKMLFVEGNEYASEKILDTEFMKLVAKELDCSTLMVGIPFKGALIAIDANSPLRMKLPVVIKNYFDNPQQDRISDKVFLVQNGEVIAMGGENLPDSQENDNFKIIEDSEQNYTIELNSKSIDQLTADVNASFGQIMTMVMQRKTFGGEIAFKLNDNIELNQTLIDKCYSYIEQIKQNELLQTMAKALTSTDVNLIFYHNQELIAPKTTEPKLDMSDLTDYSAYTDAELDEEFGRLVNSYDSEDKLKLLLTMVKLKKEYESRGIKLPSERKKWWQFWK